MRFASEEYTGALRRAALYFDTCAACIRINLTERGQELEDLDDQQLETLLRFVLPDSPLHPFITQLKEARHAGQSKEPRAKGVTHPGRDSRTEGNPAPGGN